MPVGNVTVRQAGGGSTIGVIAASGNGVFFPTVLYRYANLTLPYSPNDPGLTFQYNNSSLAPVVLLYARFFNLLNESSPATIANVGTTAFQVSGSPSFSGGTCLDVRAFGAVGDGVTDDTAAIQSALNKAAANYQGNLQASSTSALGVSSLLVQQGSAAIQNGAGNSIAVSLASPTVSGDTIILTVVAFNYTGTPAVSDSAGNLYTLVTSVTNGQLKQYLYYAPINSAAVTQITISVPGRNFNSNLVGIAAEFSEVLMPVTVDGSATIVEPNSTSFSAATLAATNHPELVISTVRTDFAAGIPPTIPSGFSLISNVSTVQPNGLNGAVPVTSMAFTNWTGGSSITPSWGCPSPTNANYFGGLTILAAFRRIVVPPSGSGITTVCIPPGVRCLVNPQEVDWQGLYQAFNAGGTLDKAVEHIGSSATAAISSFSSQPKELAMIFCTSGLTGTPGAPDSSWTFFDNPNDANSTLYVKSLPTKSAVSASQAVSNGVNWINFLALFGAANKGTLPHLVQKRSIVSGGVSAGSYTQSFTSNTQAGNGILILLTGSETSNPATITATDSQGNTYFPIFNGQNGFNSGNPFNNNSPSLIALWAPSIVGGADSITVVVQVTTFNGGTGGVSGNLLAYEIGGVGPIFSQGFYGPSAYSLVMDTGVTLEVAGALIANPNATNANIITGGVVGTPPPSVGWFLITNKAWLSNSTLETSLQFHQTLVPDTNTPVQFNDYLAGTAFNEGPRNSNIRVTGTGQIFLNGDLIGGKSASLTNELWPTALARFVCVDSSSIDTLEIIKPLGNAIEWCHSNQATITSLFIHDGNDETNDPQQRNVPAVILVDMLRNSTISNNAIQNCPGQIAILDGACYQTTISGNVVSNAYSGYLYWDYDLEFGWHFTNAGAGGATGVGEVSHNTSVTGNRVTACVAGQVGTGVQSPVNPVNVAFSVSISGGTSTAYAFLPGQPPVQFGSGQTNEPQTIGDIFTNNVSTGNIEDFEYTTYESFQQSGNNTFGGSTTSTAISNGQIQVRGEIPTVTSGSVATLAHTPSTGTLTVYVNGLKQNLNQDYTLVGNQVFLFVPLQAGDELTTDYFYGS